MATTAKSVILRDKDDGKQLLPMTRAELVIRNDGTSVETSLANKQDTLVPGTNIKTINGESPLGSGDLTITGRPGSDGVGISSVVQTTESTESGGTNVITVTMSDGSTRTFNVRNGDAVGSATIVQTTGDSKTSVMSQDGTTKALADNKSHVLKVSPNSVFVSDNNNQQLYSQRVLSFGELRNATSIIRCVAFELNAVINYYNAGSILGFFVSDTTFLHAYITGYTLKVQLKVNGTSVQDVSVGTINSSLSQINGFGDFAVQFDHDDMKFRFFSYDTSTGAVILVAEQNISTWDLSSITNVYLASSVSMRSANVACATVMVNSPSLLNKYIANKFNFGLYNTPQGTAYKEDIYLEGTGLEVGGTVTQTISATDKVVTVSNVSDTYFKLGPSNRGSNYQYMWYHVKLRFSSVGEGAYFTVGAKFRQIIIESNGLPTAIMTMSANKFYPETDTDYDLYFEFSPNSTQDYQINYGVKINGALTMEISEPYMFNKQAQNICADTFDGDGFIGSIPFSGDVVFVDYYTNHGMVPAQLQIPIGTLRIASNKVYICDGTTWKQINNS